MLTGTQKETNKAGRFTFRAPVANDGPAMYDLVDRSHPLDLNSRYCYLILCEHFSSTSVVAEQKSEHSSQIVALLTAYIPPEKLDTLFVWQIAVDASMRGQGIAKKLLADVLSRPAMKSIRYVEATVNPSNDASRNIFRALAKQYQTEINEDLLFETSLLGDGDHEQENLVRVGPLLP